jgi:DNA-binding response OmpR family regulator
MVQKILVIDDDIDLCRLIEKYLTMENYQVTLCHNGKDGIQEALKNEYILMVLDIMLPEINGFDVLSEIRKHSTIPVLMLTAKDSEGDKVAGLRMGADDYLTKPFRQSEFMARVGSLIRRYTVFNPAQQNADDELTCGELTINKIKRSVHFSGKEIVLTAKEFDMLFYLASHKGRVFTKKQLYNAVWEDEYAFDDNNVMVHIRRLRKKIEPNPDAPIYVLTVWGVGYKFGGE